MLVFFFFPSYSLNLVQSLLSDMKGPGIEVKTFLYKQHTSYISLACVQPPLSSPIFFEERGGCTQANISLANKLVSALSECHWN